MLHVIWFLEINLLLKRSLVFWTFFLWLACSSSCGSLAPPLRDSLLLLAVSKLLAFPPCSCVALCFYPTLHLLSARFWVMKQWWIRWFCGALWVVEDALELGIKWKWIGSLWLAAVRLLLLSCPVEVKWLCKWQPTWCGDCASWLLVSCVLSLRLSDGWSYPLLGGLILTAKWTYLPMMLCWG